MGTQFALVYDRFLGKITDDMYMELTPQDTIRDLQNLLIDAIPGFEFPRKVLDYEIDIQSGEQESGFVTTDLENNTVTDCSFFWSDLTSEEINILAVLMMCAWVQRQVTSIEITRMKYSGTDFKMSSQAAHLTRLLALLAECQRQSLHLQRLYKRRRTDKYGNIHSNWSVLSENSAIDGHGSTTEDNGNNRPEYSSPYIIFDGGVV